MLTFLEFYQTLLQVRARLGGRGGWHALAGRPCGERAGAGGRSWMQRGGTFSRCRPPLCVVLTVMLPAPPPPPPQFVNFKLYHSLGLRYPPALDGKLEAAAAGLEALMHDLAAAPSSAAGEPAAAGGGEADGGEERQVNPEAQQRIGSLADKVRAWGGAGLGKESNVLPGWLHAACVQGWPAAASAGWPTRRKTAAVALLPWCLLLHAPRKCLRCTLAGHPFIPCAPPPCRRPPPPPPPLPGA